MWNFFRICFFCLCNLITIIIIYFVCLFFNCLCITTTYVYMFVFVFTKFWRLFLVLAGPVTSASIQSVMIMSHLIHSIRYNCLYVYNNLYNYLYCCYYTWKNNYVMSEKSQSQQLLIIQTMLLLYILYTLIYF